MSKPKTPPRIQFEETESDADSMEEALHSVPSSLAHLPPISEPSKPRSQKAKGKTKKNKAPEATLDLHGNTRAEAIKKVSYFLNHAYHHRRKQVLIITGRGINSGEKGPVLRRMIYDWLETHAPAYVQDYYSAPPRYGGEGAIWVVLSTKNSL